MKPGIALVVVLCILGASCSSPQKSGELKPPNGAAAANFIGSWETTAGQRSLVLSIHQNGEALVLFMQPGQHSRNHVGWEAFHGGILIQNVTRIRLWPGRHDQELLAEMEHNPELDLEDRGFPTRFFMGRVGKRHMQQALLTRPIPPGWERQTLEENWATGQP